MYRFIQIISYLSLLFCAGAVVAESDFDGSKPLTCAIIEVLDCGLQERCERVLPESVNLPTFFRIDFEKKQMIGGDRTTAIKTLVHEEGNIIMQGTSGSGRAWSLLLSGETGKITAAAADQEYGFIVFGACTTN